MRFRIPPKQATKWLTLLLFMLGGYLTYSSGSMICGSVFLLATLATLAGFKPAYTVVAFFFGLLAILAPIIYLNPYLYHDLEMIGGGWISRHPALTLYLALTVSESIFLTGFYLAKCAKGENSELWFRVKKDSKDNYEYFEEDE